MVTFWAKEKQNARSNSSLVARVCRTFKSTDLPFKLLEVETATKRATAGSLNLISSTAINRAQLRAQRAEKGFDNQAASAARWDRALALFTETSQCASKSFTPFTQNRSSVQFVFRRVSTALRCSAARDREHSSACRRGVLHSAICCAILSQAPI